MSEMKRNLIKLTAELNQVLPQLDEMMEDIIGYKCIETTMDLIYEVHTSDNKTYRFKSIKCIVPSKVQDEPGTEKLEYTNFLVEIDEDGRVRAKDILRYASFMDKLYDN